MDCGSSGCCCARGTSSQAGDSSFIVQFAEDTGSPEIYATCAAAAAAYRMAPTRRLSPRILCRCRDRSEVRLCAKHAKPAASSSPKTDPDYLIEEWIGGGGMGEVFRAGSSRRNRPVAIKMISANSAPGRESQRLFPPRDRGPQRPADAQRPDAIPASSPSTRSSRSIRSSSSSWSTSTARTHWTGSRALERPLADRQRRSDRPASCCRRLDYAHSKGYVHRDVKPSNLLVMGPVHRPRVKLSDFGLAKSFAENGGFTTLTRQGDIGGSIGFISPDHIRDFSDMREPADIYGAAATLFYLLTSKYPYLGFDPREAGFIRDHPPASAGPLCALSARRPGRAGTRLAQSPAKTAARPLEIGQAPWPSPPRRSLVAGACAPGRLRLIPAVEVVAIVRTGLDLLQDATSSLDMEPRLGA